MASSKASTGRRGRSDASSGTKGRADQDSPEALMEQLVLEMAERDLFDSLRPHLQREKILTDPTGTMPIRRDMLKALARKWNLHKEPGFWTKHRDTLRLAMVLAEHGSAREALRREAHARSVASSSSGVAAGASSSLASGSTQSRLVLAGKRPQSSPGDEDPKAGIRALRRALRPYYGDMFSQHGDYSDSLLYLSRQEPKAAAGDYARGLAVETQPSAVRERGDEMKDFLSEFEAEGERIRVEEEEELERKAAEEAAAEQARRGVPRASVKGAGSGPPLRSTASRGGNGVDLLGRAAGDGPEDGARDAAGQGGGGGGGGIEASSSMRVRRRAAASAPHESTLEDLAGAGSARYKARHLSFDHGSESGGGGSEPGDDMDPALLGGYEDAGGLMHDGSRGRGGSDFGDDRHGGFERGYDGLDGARGAARPFAAGAGTVSGLSAGLTMAMTQVSGMMGGAGPAGGPALRRQCAIALRDLSRRPNARPFVLAEGAQRALLAALQEAEDDATRLDCLAALCNLTAVPSAESGIQAHFQPLSFGKESSGASLGGGTSTQSRQGRSKHDDGQSAASDEFDSVPDPTLDAGVVAVLGDFARAMGNGQAVDPTDLEVRCMLATALFNITAVRGFRDRAIAEGIVPALLTLMLPSTRQVASKGYPLSLQAAVSVLDGKILSSKQAMLASGSAASDSQDKGAFPGRDITSASAGDRGDAIEGYDDGDAAAAGGGGGTEAEAKADESGRGAGAAMRDADGKDQDDGDARGMPKATEAASDMQRSGDGAPVHSGSPLESDRFGLALAAADAYCLACCTRGLCNVSGAARGAEAIVASGAVAALCGLWDLFTHGLRGAIASHIIYNLTRTRSAARKVAEEGGVLILRDTMVSIAEMHYPAALPSHAPADGSSGAAAPRPVLRPEPGSTGATEGLSPEQSFVFRRSALALSRLTRDEHAATVVLRTRATLALCLGALVPLDATPPLPHEALRAEAAAAAEAAEALEPGIDEASRDAVAATKAAAAAAAASASASGASSKHGNASDPAAPRLSADPERVFSTADGVGVAHSSGLSAGGAGAGSVLSAAHVRRRVAGALCRLSWRADRNAAAVACTGGALASLILCGDGAARKVALTAASNFMRHPAAAACVIRDGLLAVLVAATAPEHSAVQSRITTQAPEMAASLSALRASPTWDREAYLALLALYNASCHAPIRRVLLKLRGSDVVQACVALEAGTTVSACLAIAVAHSSGTALPSETLLLLDASDADDPAAHDPFKPQAYDATAQREPRDADSDSDTDTSLSLPVLAALMEAVGQGTERVRAARLRGEQPEVDVSDLDQPGAFAGNTAGSASSTGFFAGAASSPQPDGYQDSPPRRLARALTPKTPAVLADGMEAPPGAPLWHLCLLSFSLATIRNLSSEVGYQARLLAAGCLPRLMTILKAHRVPGSVSAADSDPRARRQRHPLTGKLLTERDNWDCPYPLHCVSDAIHTIANLAHDVSCRTEIARGGCLAALVPVAEDADNSVLAVALNRAKNEAIQAFQARARAQQDAQDATERAARMVAELDPGAMTKAERLEAQKLAGTATDDSRPGSADGSDGSAQGGSGGGGRGLKRHQSRPAAGFKGAVRSPAGAKRKVKIAGATAKEAAVNAAKDAASSGAAASTAHGGGSKEGVRSASDSRASFSSSASHGSDDHAPGGSSGSDALNRKQSRARMAKREPPPLMDLETAERVETLTQAAVEARTQCALALSTIVCSEEGTVKDLASPGSAGKGMEPSQFLELGILDALNALCKFGSDGDSIRARVVAAMRALSAHQEVAAAMLQKTGLLDTLVRMLSSSVDNARREAVAVISNLSQAPGLELKMVDAGVVRALMVAALLRTHDSVTQARCIQSLHNLLASASARERVLSEGVIWALQRLALSSDKATQRACAVTLHRLATDHDAQSVLVKEGGLRSVISVLLAAHSKRAPDSHGAQSGAVVAVSPGEGSLALDSAQLNSTGGFGTALGPETGIGAQQASTKSGRVELVAQTRRPGELEQLSIMEVLNSARRPQGKQARRPRPVGRSLRVANASASSRRTTPKAGDSAVQLHPDVLEAAKKGGTADMTASMSSLEAVGADPVVGAHFAGVLAAVSREPGNEAKLVSEGAVEALVLLCESSFDSESDPVGFARSPSKDATASAAAAAAVASSAVSGSRAGGASKRGSSHGGLSKPSMSNLRPSCAIGLFNLSATPNAATRARVVRGGTPGVFVRLALTPSEDGMTRRLSALGLIGLMWSHGSKASEQCCTILASGAVHALVAMAVGSSRFADSADLAVVKRAASQEPSSEPAERYAAASALHFLSTVPDAAPYLCDPAAGAVEALAWLTTEVLGYSAARATSASPPAALRQRITLQLDASAMAANALANLCALPGCSARVLTARASAPVIVMNDATDPNGDVVMLPSSLAQTASQAAAESASAERPDASPVAASSPLASPQGMAVTFGATSPSGSAAAATATWQLPVAVIIHAESDGTVAPDTLAPGMAARGSAGGRAIPAVQAVIESGIAAASALQDLRSRASLQGGKSGGRNPLRGTLPGAADAQLGPSTLRALLVPIIGSASSSPGRAQEPSYEARSLATALAQPWNDELAAVGEAISSVTSLQRSVQRGKATTVELASNADSDAEALLSVLDATSTAVAAIAGNAAIARRRADEIAALEATADEEEFGEDDQRTRITRDYGAAAVLATSGGGGQGGGGGGTGGGDGIAKLLEAPSSRSRKHVPGRGDAASRMSPRERREQLEQETRDEEVLLRRELGERGGRGGQQPHEAAAAAATQAAAAATSSAMLRGDWLGIAEHGVGAANGESRGPLGLWVPAGSPLGTMRSVVSSVPKGQGPVTWDECVAAPSWLVDLGPGVVSTKLASHGAVALLGRALSPQLETPRLVRLRAAVGLRFLVTVSPLAMAAFVAAEEGAPVRSAVAAAAVVAAENRAYEIAALGAAPTPTDSVGSMLHLATHPPASGPGGADPADALPRSPMPVSSLLGAGADQVGLAGTAASSSLVSSAVHAARLHSAAMPGSRDAAAQIEAARAAAEEIRRRLELLAGPITGAGLWGITERFASACAEAVQPASREPVDVPTARDGTTGVPQAPDGPRPTASSSSSSSSGGGRTGAAAATAAAAAAGGGSVVASVIATAGSGAPSSGTGGGGILSPPGRASPRSQQRITFSNSGFTPGMSSMQSSRGGSAAGGASSSSPRASAPATGRTRTRSLHAALLAEADGGCAVTESARLREELVLLITAVAEESTTRSALVLAGAGGALVALGLVYDHTGTADGALVPVGTAAAEELQRLRINTPLERLTPAALMDERTQRAALRGLCNMAIATDAALQDAGSKRVTAAALATSAMREGGVRAQVRKLIGQRLRRMRSSGAMREEAQLGSAVAASDDDGSMMGLGASATGSLSGGGDMQSSIVAMARAAAGEGGDSGESQDPTVAVFVGCGQRLLQETAQETADTSILSRAQGAGIPAVSDAGELGSPSAAASRSAARTGARGRSGSARLDESTGGSTGGAVAALIAVMGAGEAEYDRTIGQERAVADVIDPCGPLARMRAAGAAVPPPPAVAPASDDRAVLARTGASADSTMDADGAGLGPFAVALEPPHSVAALFPCLGLHRRLGALPTPGLFSRAEAAWVRAQAVAASGRQGNPAYRDDEDDDGDDDAVAGVVSAPGGVALPLTGSHWFRGFPLRLLHPRLVAATAAPCEIRALLSQAAAAAAANSADASGTGLSGSSASGSDGDSEGDGLSTTGPGGASSQHHGRASMVGSSAEGTAGARRSQGPREADGNDNSAGMRRDASGVLAPAFASQSGVEDWMPTFGRTLSLISGDGRPAALGVSLPTMLRVGFFGALAVPLPLACPFPAASVTAASGFGVPIDVPAIGGLYGDGVVGVTGLGGDAGVNLPNIKLRTPALALALRTDGSNSKRVMAAACEAARVAFRVGPDDVLEALSSAPPLLGCLVAPDIAATAMEARLRLDQQARALAELLGAANTSSGKASPTRASARISLSLGPGEASACRRSVLGSAVPSLAAEHACAPGSLALWEGQGRIGVRRPVQDMGEPDKPPAREAWPKVTDEAITAGALDTPRGDGMLADMPMTAYSGTAQPPRGSRRRSSAFLQATSALAAAASTGHVSSTLETEEEAMLLAARASAAVGRGGDPNAAAVAALYAVSNNGASELPGLLATLQHGAGSALEAMADKSGGILPTGVLADGVGLDDDEYVAERRDAEGADDVDEGSTDGWGRRHGATGSAVGGRGGAGGEHGQMRWEVAFPRLVEPAAWRVAINSDTFKASVRLSAQAVERFAAAALLAGSSAHGGSVMGAESADAKLVLQALSAARVRMLSEHAHLLPFSKAVSWVEPAIETDHTESPSTAQASNAEGGDSTRPRNSVSAPASWLSVNGDAAEAAANGGGRDDRSDELDTEERHQSHRETVAEAVAMAYRSSDAEIQLGPWLGACAPAAIAARSVLSNGLAAGVLLMLHCTCDATVNRLGWRVVVSAGGADAFMGSSSSGSAANLVSADGLRPIFTAGANGSIAAAAVSAVTPGLRFAPLSHVLSAMDPSALAEASPPAGGQSGSRLGDTDYHDGDDAHHRPVAVGSGVAGNPRRPRSKLSKSHLPQDSSGEPGSIPAVPAYLPPIAPKYEPEQRSEGEQLQVKEPEHAVRRRSGAKRSSRQRAPKPAPQSLAMRSLTTETVAGRLRRKENEAKVGARKAELEAKSKGRKSRK